jgi:very-short-patch-repair endonuclease
LAGLSTSYKIALVRYRGVQSRAKALRRVGTPAEETLWEILRDRTILGLKFRRQQPIGPYVADFYCHELKLIVEVDGLVHDGDRQIANDRNRDANLAALGCTILRFTNDEVLLNAPSVLSRIASVVRGTRWREL